MALTNYTDLQAAVRTETSVQTGGLAADVITDAIKRAEAKINRRARFRAMEQLAYATYSNGSRYLALPSRYLELINLRVKLATAADIQYVDVPYVSSIRLWEYYRAQADSDVLRYTLRDQLEFSHEVTSDHTVMMHYLKALDIASDTTNWVLTNMPDVYLYGALSECELHLKNDTRVAIWKALFDEGIRELNLLDERGRDDAELDISELSRVAQSDSFNILTGR